MNVTIPGYEVAKLLGKGGMGVVYLCTQTSLNRSVALKVLSPELVENETFCKRFLREGRTIASVAHRKIITIYDIGHHGDHYYMSMEYLPGGSLADKIRKRRLALPTSISIIKTIADALGYAHSKGIIHRDIKPLNILFRDDRTPILTDFGIAKTMKGDVTLTVQGMVFGSPSYMSPEQITGKEVGPQSDLYSLGIVFYKLLTGELPYESTDPISIALKHLQEPIPQLTGDMGILQPLIDKLLAKDLDERFQTAEQFIGALREVEEQMFPGIHRDHHTGAQLQYADADKTVPRIISRAQDQLQDKTILNKGADTHQRKRKAKHIALLLSIIGGTALVVFAAWQVVEQSTTPKEPLETELPKAQEAKSEQPMQRQREIGPHMGATVAESQADTTNLEQARSEARRQAEEVRRQVEEARRRAGIDQLLNRAESQQQASKLSSPAGDNAYESYRAVLALDPANHRAKEGLENIARQFARTARQFREAGRLNEGLGAIEQGLRVEPQNKDLVKLEKELRTELAEHERRLAEEARRREKIDRLLTRAESQSQASKNTPSAGYDAYETYNAALALDPENETAKQGLKIIATQYERMARNSYKANRFQASMRQIDRGLRVQPDNKRLMGLRLDVQAAQAKQLRIQAEQTHAKYRKIARLLLRADRQRKASRLTTPPNDNAYQSYHSVLKLDPANRDAQRGLAEIAAHYLRSAQAAFSSRRLDASIQYIETGLRVQPRNKELLELRSKIKAAQESDRRKQAARKQEAEARIEQDRDVEKDQETTIERADPKREIKLFGTF